MIFGDGLPSPLVYHLSISVVWRVGRIDFQFVVKELAMLMNDPHAVDMLALRRHAKYVIA